MKQENRTAVGAAVWSAASCAIHMVFFKGKLDTAAPIAVRLLFAVLAIGLTLPLHEVIHYLFMRLFGIKHAAIELGRDPLGLPSLRTAAREEVRGGKWVVILLAPFLLLTPAPDILFCLSERVHLLFFIMAIANSAGCYFDLADVVRNMRG